MDSTLGMSLSLFISPISLFLKKKNYSYERQFENAVERMGKEPDGSTEKYTNKSSGRNQAIGTTEIPLCFPERDGKGECN